MSRPHTSPAGATRPTVPTAASPTTEIAHNQPIQPIDLKATRMKAAERSVLQRREKQEVEQPFKLLNSIGVSYPPAASPSSHFPSPSHGRSPSPRASRISGVQTSLDFNPPQHVRASAKKNAYTHVAYSPPSTAPHGTIYADGRPIHTSQSAWSNSPAPSPRNVRMTMSSTTPFDPVMTMARSRPIASPTEQKELIPHHKSHQPLQHHAPEVTKQLHLLSTRLAQHFDPSNTNPLSNPAAMAAHHRTVQEGLECLKSMGSLFGPEGASLASKLSTLFAQSIFTTFDTPSSFATTPQHTYRQEAHLLAKRLQTAETMLQNALEETADHSQEGSSNRANSVSAATPSASQESTPLTNPRGKPMISLERFYKQLDLLAKQMMGTDALEQQINDLKQDLYRADAQAHHMNKEKQDLQQQLELLNGTLAERDRLHEQEMISFHQQYGGGHANTAATATPAPTVSTLRSTLSHYRTSHQFVLEDSEEFKTLWVKYQEAVERGNNLQSQLRTAQRVSDSYRVRAHRSQVKEDRDIAELNSLRAEVAQLKHELATRLRPLTPRPDWTKFPILSVTDFSSPLVSVSTSGGAGGGGGGGGGPTWSSAARRAREFEAILESGGKDIEETSYEDEHEESVSSGTTSVITAKSSATNSPLKSMRKLSVPSSPPPPTTTSEPSPSSSSPERPSALQVEIPSAGVTLDPLVTLSDIPESANASPIEAIPIDLSSAAPPTSDAPLSATTPLEPLQGSPSKSPQSAADGIAFTLPATLPSAQHTFFPRPPGNDHVTFLDLKPEEKKPRPSVEFDQNGMAIPQNIEESTQARLWSLYLSYRQINASREMLQERVKKVLRSLNAELRETKEKLSIAEAFISDVALNTIHAHSHDGGANTTGDDSLPTMDQSLSNTPAPLEVHEPSSRSRHVVKYFIGLGIDPDVPLYLRSTGKIRNKNFGKRECEQLIRQVLQARREYVNDPKGNKEITLSEYFYVYLKKKFGVKSLVLEWGYGMIDALERYRWDADCELFLKMLRGTLHEDCYIDQCAMIEKLLSLAVKLDMALHGKPSGKVPKALFLYTLKNLFPLKGNKELHEISKCLNTDQPGPVVVYSKLFEETSQGDQGLFAEKIRDTHLEEIEEFMIELQDRSSRGTGSSALNDPISGIDELGKISLSDVRQAWIHLDPARPVEEIEHCIALGIDLPLDALSTLKLSTRVTLTTFFKKLFAKTLVKRYRNWDPNAKPHMTVSVNLKRAYTNNTAVSASITSPTVGMLPSNHLPRPSSRNSTHAALPATPSIPMIPQLPPSPTSHSNPRRASSTVSRRASLVTGGSPSLTGSPGPSSSMLSSIRRASLNSMTPGDDL